MEPCPLLVRARSHGRLPFFDRFENDLIQLHKQPNSGLRTVATPKPGCRGFRPSVGRGQALRGGDPYQCGSQDQLGRRYRCGTRTPLWSRGGPSPSASRPLLPAPLSQSILEKAFPRSGTPVSTEFSNPQMAYPMPTTGHPNLVEIVRLEADFGLPFVHTEMKNCVCLVFLSRPQYRGRKMAFVG
jgi:hypothetical protein